MTDKNRIRVTISCDPNVCQIVCQIRACQHSISKSFVYSTKNFSRELVGSLRELASIKYRISRVSVVAAEQSWLNVCPLFKY